MLPETLRGGRRREGADDWASLGEVPMRARSCAGRDPLSSGAQEGGAGGEGAQGPARRQLLSTCAVRGGQNPDARDRDPRQGRRAVLWAVRAAGRRRDLRSVPAYQVL